MVKYFVITLLLWIFSCLLALPAFATVCRNYDNHKICILSINRSAKNYWEYRAVVSVDGVKGPKEVYNCRAGVRVQHDGAVVPFKDNDAGNLICNFFTSRHD